MSALSDTFIYAYEFESGALLTDSKGSNTLTNTNTVTSTTGKVGNAATFVRTSSQSLLIADNAAVSIGGTNAYWALWVNLASKGAVGTGNGLVCKDDTGVNREYLIIYDTPTDRFRLQTWTAASSVGGVSLLANNFGAVSTGTWYFIQAWRDGTNNFISVNNGTPDSGAASNAGWNGAADLKIGTLNNIAEWNNDGQTDQLLFAKTIPSDSDKGFLYNSGSGQSWASVVAGPSASSLTGGKLSSKLLQGRL